MNKNNNLDDMPLTDIDYEGVIYEPSDAVGQDIPESKPKATSVPKAPKKKVAQNFNFNIFIGIMGAISLGLIVLTFSLISPYISEYFSIPSSKATEDALAFDKSSNTGDDFFNNINNIEDLSLNTSSQNNLTGVIRDINYEEGYFVIYDFKLSEAYNIKVKPSTKFSDRFGLPLTVQELQIGDIVDFSFDNADFANYINLNPDTFSIENVRPERVGISEAVLMLNGTNYDVSNTADIYKGLSLLTLADVSTADKISVKGYGSTIYSIRVNSTTGTLVLINKPNLANGIIEIDRDFFKPLDTVERVELDEGEHKLVIKCSTLDPYLKDFIIEADKETILDLSDLQNKPGNLLIKANVSDYDLYVNGEIIEDGGPLSLIYGTYAIKLVKESYETYETQISINKPNDTLEIEMEKIEKLGTLSLSSNPAGAQVFIDNILVGETPLKYKLSHGMHNIKLTLDGYNDFLLSSVSISDEDSDFNVTMHQKAVETTQATTVQVTQAVTEATTEATTITPVVATQATTSAPIVTQTVVITTQEPVTQTQAPAIVETEALTQTTTNPILVATTLSPVQTITEAITETTTVLVASVPEVITVSTTSSSFPTFE